MHINHFAIPSDHPRARSLYIREMLVDGFRRGLVVPEGLIAHGRGEAYDYLLGERTTETAQRAIKAAAAMLLLSSRPVISVNGNTAALCANTVVELAKVAGASIEVNIFYRTEKREMAIKAELELHGAKRVLGVGSKASARIPELQSERRRVDPDGIYAADTVLVPLEDGDRTEALIGMNKTVITIDLNPLSRTSRAANITIVDNVVRAMPALVEAARKLRGTMSLKKITDNYDNSKNLQESLKIIKGEA
ncbi:MAG: phosphopantothenate/pantothenate synthetase [Thermoproteota archaeon]|nr:phosphopantothenate/pantothenate synthetase [Thermoproteota archaeon]MDQ4017986.1 phosphopantothenate/pantothenate synthetase [Thermoproteota archaeon]